MFVADFAPNFSLVLNMAPLNKWRRGVFPSGENYQWVKKPRNKPNFRTNFKKCIHQVDVNFIHFSEYNMLLQ